jgi:hypothetical protein
MHVEGRPLHEISRTTSAADDSIFRTAGRDGILSAPGERW